MYGLPRHLPRPRNNAPVKSGDPQNNSATAEKHPNLNHTIEKRRRKSWLTPVTLGSQQFMPTNATAARKQENPDVSSFVPTESSCSKTEKQSLPIQLNAEADPVRFAAQRAPLFATARQSASPKETLITTGRREKTRICFGKPPAKCAENRTGQTGKLTCASTAKNEGKAPMKDKQAD
jgi:hypothetical protein